VGCDGDKIAPAPNKTKAPGTFPYQSVPSGGEDPGENGPDDETEMDAIEGEMGKVMFTHFTHASNSKKGYGIPCQTCHHQTPAGEDPGEGCVDCHEAPKEGADPANGGPEDNLILGSNNQETMPVPFNHFTHTSSDGYKLACSQCHHTGENIACSDCHKQLAMMGEDDQIIPKAKRAFHLQCKGCHQAIEKNQLDTIAPTACKECHNDRNLLRVKEDEDLALNRALHIQCIGCHQGVNRAKPEAKAPTENCTGCHQTEIVVEEELLEEEEAETVEEIVRDPELEKKVGPENMIIDHVQKKKSGVPFPHKKHQELGEDCYSCHHKGLQDPTCRTCHDEVKDAKKIYHKNCISCHKENDIPAKCDDCHPK
jgi:hypothetical protein